MLKSFSANNFRTLTGEPIQFEPLTFLVGPNAAGKSNILKCLHSFSRIIRNYRYYNNRNDEGRNAIASDFLNGNISNHVGFGVSVQIGDNETCGYNLTFKIHESDFEIVSEKISGTGFNLTRREGSDRKAGTIFESTHPDIDPEIVVPFNKTRESFLGIFNVALYRFNAQRIMTPSSLGDSQLSAEGEKFPAFLDDMRDKRDPEGYKRVVDTFRTIFPHVKNLTLPTVIGSRKTISFMEGSNGFSPGIDNSSDGMVLVLAYLSVCLDSCGPKIICIEEPENGLHPGLIGYMTDFFRGITEGRFGNKPIQIILTTHSPILLNFAKPEEVRIVRRTDEGRTKVKALTEIKGWERLYKSYDRALGELWFSGSLESLADKA